MNEINRDEMKSMKSHKNISVKLVNLSIVNNLKIEVICESKTKMFNDDRLFLFAVVENEKKSTDHHTTPWPYLF